MQICVVGAGYVGLVTGACFASLGNKVICVDIDKEKIRSLRKGVCPIYEPKLEEMIRDEARKGRLDFTADLKSAVKKCAAIFIAVGTPPKDSGEADLSYIENVAREIALNMPAYRLIVEKSTVPVQTGARIEETIKGNNRKKVAFDMASNPEFLREGQAIDDFMHPDRIVIGVRSQKATELLTKLYEPLKAPIVVTDIESAELIKHASNSFLATKISFMNAVSNICEKSGADIQKVAEGMGLDKRIGGAFLNAGVGFGGFCFPKDLEAFMRISEKLGYDFDILRAVKRVNDQQKILFVKKVEEALWVLKGKTVGIWGLAFKPDTDDMRYAPSIDVITMLKNEGVKIKAYDPKAVKNAKKIFGDEVAYSKNAYEAADGADCIAVLTEWDEFKEIDLGRVRKKMRQPVIVDGRNIYNPAAMKKLGFKYVSMGRG